MKIFTFLLLIMVSLKVSAQVVADPALSQMRFTAIFQDTALNANSLPIDQIIHLKVPVSNKNVNNALPSGTCKVKVGLGSKLILDPAFNLSTVNTSNYFHWTSEVYGGQVQVTGELMAQLPANFYDTATFDVKGTILGSSTITTNFLVTNHNTTVILSDEDPTNNTSFIPYTINQGSGPIPVKFTKLFLGKEACNIKVDFDAENEINVKRYEIEVSRDGMNFTKIGQVNAGNLVHYHYSFPITDNLKGPYIYIRVKSLDFDDKFQYSETKRVTGNCSTGWHAILYPNPAAQQVKQVVIATDEGIFNGNYKISLWDMAGKLISTKSLTLVNTVQFIYEIGNLASGEYLIKLINDAGTESAVLKLQRL